MTGRWEGDERGHGVADAAHLVPGASELVTAFRQSAWVAEDPELHLLPHVEAWCESDGRLVLSRAFVDTSGAYALEVEWRGEPPSVGQVRAAVFALVGSFAESATYVRQRHDGALRFEIGTGEVAPDVTFDPHGHVVVIDVLGG